MKKLSIVFLALTLALAVSCGDTPDVTDGTDTAAPAETTAAPVEDIDDTEAVETTADTAPIEDAVFTAVLDNGVTVIIGGNADELIFVLGAPEAYMEAPSCVHEGFDKVYTYDGFSITTSPAADKTQYVAELSLLSDAVALEGGLMIGSDASEAEAVFGSDFEEQFGVRKYTLNGATASVILDGDTISGITVSATKN